MLELEGSKLPLVPYVMTLGNVFIVLSIFGAIGTGVYETGVIRATLQDGIQTEHDARQIEARHLEERINEVNTSVRELQRYVMNTSSYTDQRVRIKP